MHKIISAILPVILVFLVFDAALILPISIPFIGQFSLGRLSLLLLLPFIILMLINQLYNRRYKFFMPLQLQIFVAWVIFAAINLFSSDMAPNNSRYLLNLIFNSLCFLLSFYFAKTASFKQITYFWTLYAVLLFSYVDLIFKWRPPIARQWDFTNEVVGAFANPLFLGYILAFYLITTSFRIAYSRDGTGTRDYILLIMIAPLVPFVGSRTLLVIAGITLVLLLVLSIFRFRQSKYRLPIITSMYLVIFLILTSPFTINRLPDALINKFSTIGQLVGDSEAREGNSRFTANEQAVTSLAQSPWLGFGPGGAEQQLAKDPYLVDQGNINPHNFWLELLLNFGILGTALFVISFLLTIVRTWNILIHYRYSVHNVEAISYLLAFIFLVVGPSSINNFAFPWIMLGYSFVYSTLDSHQQLKIQIKDSAQSNLSFQYKSI